MDGLEKADVFTDDDKQNDSSSGSELSGDSDDANSIVSDPSDDHDSDEDEDNKSRDSESIGRRDGDQEDHEQDGDEDNRSEHDKNGQEVDMDVDANVEVKIKEERIDNGPQEVKLEEGAEEVPARPKGASGQKKTTPTQQKVKQEYNTGDEGRADVHDEQEVSSDEDAPLIAQIRVNGKQINPGAISTHVTEDADGVDGDSGLHEGDQKAPTLLDAAEMVLEGVGPEGLHIKEIQKRCTDRDLIHASKKKSLDALIYREAQRGSDRFTKVDGQPGYFALASEEDKALMIARKAQRAEKVRLERHRKRASNERKLRYLKKTVRMMLFINTAMHEEMKALEASARKISRSKRQLVQRLKKSGEPIPSFIHESSASEQDVNDAEARRGRTDTQRPSSSWQRTFSQPEGPAPTQPNGVAQHVPRSRPKPPAALDIDVELDAQGVPVEPFKVGPITVHSLGNIEYHREGYHSDRYIWPIGFTSERQGNSYIDLEERVNYTCKIIDGGDAPLFEVRAADDPDNPIVAPSSTSASVMLMHRIKKARTGEINSKVTTSGPSFFGLSRPYVRKAILLMPNSDKLVNFNPHALDDSHKYGRRPGSEQKTANTDEPMRKRRKRTPATTKTNSTNDLNSSQTFSQTKHTPRNTTNNTSTTSIANVSVGVTGGGGGVAKDGSGAPHTNVIHVRKPSAPKLTFAQKLSKRRPTNKRTSGFV